MILLVQNNDAYENDLRAMISAFFPVEKIRTALPAEVAEYEKKFFGEFSFIFTALYDEGTTRLRIEENIPHPDLESHTRKL